jgi:hypothetical protein
LLVLLPEEVAQLLLVVFDVLLEVLVHLTKFVALLDQFGILS